jgi:hypothetical protein
MYFVWQKPGLGGLNGNGLSILKNEKERKGNADSNVLDLEVTMRGKCFT